MMCNCQPIVICINKIDYKISDDYTLYSLNSYKIEIKLQYMRSFLLTAPLSMFNYFLTVSIFIFFTYNLFFHNWQVHKRLHFLHKQNNKKAFLQLKSQQVRAKVQHPTSGILTTTCCPLVESSFTTTVL